MGQIGKGQCIISQQAGDHQWKRSILRAADLNFSLKRFSASYPNAIHLNLLCCIQLVIVGGNTRLYRLVTLP